MLSRIDAFNANQKWVILVLFVGIIILATFKAIPQYSGNAFIYLLFTIVTNTLFYLGFRRDAIFFDAFIGLFFWLGFWLKLTFRLIFTNGKFIEPTGYFKSTDFAAYDQALLVASCGLFGLIMANTVRRYFSFNYPNKMPKLESSGIFAFYKKNRNLILFFFIVLILSVAISNALLGIYQRGLVAQTTLPFGLNGIYKWLLLFGLASFAALILRFEFEIQKRASLFAIFLSLLENFTSNVSLLSRGMILNASGLLYGILISLKIYSYKLRWHTAISVLFIFGILFSASILSVNYIRSYKYDSTKLVSNSKTVNSINSVAPTTSIHPIHTIDINTWYAAVSYLPPLLTDRWVGMEGVMAVSSYPHLGWDLWKRALKEKYDEGANSFYDLHILGSYYADIDKTRHHFISLPGIIAFFFYPGSYLFLFISMFSLGCFAALTEGLVYKLGDKNIMLCALMAQVIAYRFANFGYVPAQSYLLLGALLLNLFIIYFLNLFFKFKKYKYTYLINRLPVKNDMKTYAITLAAKKCTMKVSQ